MSLSPVFRVLFVMMVAGCATSPNAVTTSSDSARAVTALAVEIAQGVGAVQTTSSPAAGNPRGAVVVFEERHSSTTGQLEIAVMLLRLRDRGVRFVGLEGALQGERLDGSWYRGLGASHGRHDREDVALQLLLDGEISAAEFLALVHEDVDVRGLETRELYAVDLDVPGWPEAGYLLRLAESSLLPTEESQLAEMAANGSTAEISSRFLEADPWVKARWQEMKRVDATVEEVASRLRLVKTRVEGRRVKIEDGLRRDFGLALRFFEVAARRSEVMAESLAAQSGQARVSTGAMIVGAAHGQGVRTSLARASLAAVSIRPASFSAATGLLSAPAYERKRRGLWGGDYGRPLGCTLNATRKPPPIIATASARAYLWAYEAIRSLARALRDHKDLARVAAALPKSPDGALETLRADGTDLVARLSLANTAGGRTPVWVRARARGGLDSSSVAVEGLEKTLLALLARDRAGSVTSDADEEPGAMRIGRDVRAIFGGDEREVATVGFKTAPRSDPCSSRTN